MRYIMYPGIFLVFAVLFTASSGITNVEANPDQRYSNDRNYHENRYSYDEKGLYNLDEDFLEGLDKKMLLNTALNLLNGLDIDKLNEQLTQEEGGSGAGFVLILVLFILLIIVGAGFG